MNIMFSCSGFYASFLEIFQKLSGGIDGPRGDSYHYVKISRILPETA